MDLFIKFSLIAICIFIAWRTLKMFKANPELFSKQSLGKSLTTMGVLALILIGIVALMIMILKTA